MLVPRKHDRTSQPPSNGDAPSLPAAVDAALLRVILTPRSPSPHKALTTGAAAGRDVGWHSEAFLTARVNQHKMNYTKTPFTVSPESLEKKCLPFV